MMNGSGTRLRDVCALRYDVAQSLLSAGGSLSSPMISVTHVFLQQHNVLGFGSCQSCSIGYPKMPQNSPPPECPEPAEKLSF